MPWWANSKHGYGYDKAWSWPSHYGGGGAQAQWSQGQPDAPSGRSWQCSVCQANNNAPKTCAKCGCRRLYADAAKAAIGPKQGAQPPPPPSAGQSTRTQLENLTKRLNAIGPHGDAAVQAPTPAVYSVATPPPEEIMPIVPVDKKATKERIRSLEATLSTLSPADQDLKGIIADKIAAAKAEISACRPLGARVDQARSALVRAQQRDAEAQSAVEAAIQLQQTTAAGVVSIERDLQELELELLNAPAPPPVEVTAATAESAMCEAQKYLGQMLSMLKTDQHVDPQHVESAMGYVNQLFVGYRQTMVEAKRAKEAAAVAANGGQPVRRIVGKTDAAIVLPKVAPLMRNYGKLPLKRRVNSVFATVPPCRKKGKNAAPTSCM